MAKAKKSCKYHHNAAAEWSCVNCDTSFCQSCVPYGHSPLWGSGGPRCLLCNQNLEYLGGSSDKPAFWTMLWHFFQYPLHTNSLIVIFSISIISFLLPMFGFISFGLLIFLFSISVKYSFSILESRANNESEPPSFSSLLEKDEHYLFLKLVAIVFIMFGAAVFLSGDNAGLFQVLNGIITFMLPAITIILAIEKSLTQAINPLNVFSFILRIGWAYLLVWFCYQIVSSGPNFIMPALYNIIPDFLVLPFFVILALYFWFAASCMLGYTVYQYQDVLGHVTIDDEHLEVEQRIFEQKRALAEAYILLRENNLESAKKILRPVLDRYQDEADLHEFYHKILLLEGNKESIGQHADYFIKMLMQQNKEQLAASVYQDTIAKFPAYKVPHVETSFELAKLLEGRGKKDEMMRLLTNLHKVEPTNPLVPQAYLMLARLFSEHKDNDAQAIKILDFILQKYPNSVVKPAAVEYKSMLKQLAQKS